MSDITDTITEWAFDAGWRLNKRLPQGMSRAAFQLAADRMWKRRGPSVRQLETNIARVDRGRTPAEVRTVSKEGMRNYLRYWNEAFRLPSWSPERVRDTFSLENTHLLDEGVRAGAGVIMVPSHMGNWDHAGAWACLRYGGITTVAERLKPEGLFDQFLEYRRTLGMEVVPLGDPDIVRTLARRVKEGRVLALLGDRDISRSGVEVSFFGEPAALPAGPALLGLMTGAPVHPVTMWFDGERCTGRIYERIVPAPGLSRREQVLDMTQQIAHCYEEGIRDHPADWHLLQPVWRADLEAPGGASSHQDRRAT